ncbi:MAG: hypothetical protein H7A09_07535 [Oceanospirillaceae bacterium]|nr:hypothetical protein [Oceanospirillaceae bacterium]MCP5349775.1 hypothetical protein [Oceanospirillaceae bacterium]
MLNKILLCSAVLLLLFVLAHQPVHILFSHSQAEITAASTSPAAEQSSAALAAVTAPVIAAQIAPELSDVNLPGLYDAQGKLDMAQVKLLLDFFLSDKDSLESRKSLTCQTLQQQAKEEDKIQLQNLCERYFTYRAQWYALASSLQPNNHHAGQSDLQQALAQRENLQRSLFSADEQTALFGRDNAYDEWMQQRMQTPAAQREQLDNNMQHISEAKQAADIRSTESAQRALQQDAEIFSQQLSCYALNKQRNTQDIQTLCDLSQGQLLRIRNHMAISP